MAARRGASELAILKEAEDEATRIVAAARDGACGRRARDPPPSLSRAGFRSTSQPRSSFARRAQGAHARGGRRGGSRGGRVPRHARAAAEQLDARGGGNAGTTVRISARVGARVFAAAAGRSATRCRFFGRLLPFFARRRRVTADTDAGLAALDAEFMRNKDLVIGMLLQMVLSIENPFAAK